MRKYISGARVLMRAVARFTLYVHWALPFREARAQVEEVRVERLSLEWCFLGGAAVRRCSSRLSRAVFLPRTSRCGGVAGMLGRTLCGILCIPLARRGCGC